MNTIWLITYNDETWGIIDGQYQERLAAIQEKGQLGELIPEYVQAWERAITVNAPDVPRAIRKVMGLQAAQRYRERYR